MPPKGWKKGVATLGPPPPGAVEAYNAGLLERPAHHTDVGVLFRKVAPNLYCAVQYRIENGVIIETKADHIHDTLDHTASTVATAIAKLINNGGVP